MEKKVYELIKPTFRHKAGMRVKWYNYLDGYYKDDYGCFYTKEEIENNPEWWELVEENKVNDIWYVGINTSDQYCYNIKTSHSISKSKYPSIIAAIEKELNS